MRKFWNRYCILYSDDTTDDGDLLTPFVRGQRDPKRIGLSMNGRTLFSHSSPFFLCVYVIFSDFWFSTIGPPPPLLLNSRTRSVWPGNFWMEFALMEEKKEVIYNTIDSYMRIVWQWPFLPQRRTTCSTAQSENWKILFSSLLYSFPPRL
jgi:hypothetical protein